MIYLCLVINIMRGYNMKFRKNGEQIIAQVDNNTYYSTYPDGTGLRKLTYSVGGIIPTSIELYSKEQIDFRGIIHYKKKFRNAIDKYLEGET